MNAAKILCELRRERNDWAGYGQGPEVSWTKNGVERAITIVRALAKQDRILREGRRPALSRWCASELYCAVRQAITLLGRGDRAKAIRLLSAAKDAADHTRRNLP